MDIRNKIFWGIFYTLVYGYLMDGLVRLNESPIDSVKNFPLQFRENKISVVKEVSKAL